MQLYGRYKSKLQPRNHCNLLYKIDYALQKGLLKAFCTSASCSRNKSTKCDIKSKKIQDIIIRKKIRSKSNNEELDTYKEKERSEE